MGHISGARNKTGSSGGSRRRCGARGAARPGRACPFTGPRQWSTSGCVRRLFLGGRGLQALCNTVDDAPQEIREQACLTLEIFTTEIHLTVNPVAEFIFN